MRRERLRDVVDGLARRGREREVALALDAERVALARLLVELRVAGLALVRERLGLGLEPLGLARVLAPLLDELDPQPLHRARARRPGLRCLRVDDLGEHRTARRRLRNQRGRALHDLAP